MRIFSWLYEKVLRWAAHPHAPYYLAGVSFAESSFFPVPPDVMLMSMNLAKPQKAWHFALLTTLCSVLGGIFGYFIGVFFFQIIQPYLAYLGYMDSFHQVESWFRLWGFWVVFIAGFSPIPYKVFTITAGLMRMAFLPFLFASIVSRGLRFFLVSALMLWGGEKLQRGIHRYIDLIGWACVVILFALYLFYHFRG